MYERISSQYRREELTAVSFKLEGIAIRQSAFPATRLLRLVEQIVDALRQARSSGGNDV